MATTIQQPLSDSLAPARSNAGPIAASHSVNASIASVGNPPAPPPTTASIAATTDQKPLVNFSVFEYLLIEMVPLARRVVADVKTHHESESDAQKVARGVATLSLEEKTEDPDTETQQDTGDAPKDTAIEYSTPLQTLHLFPHMAAADDENVFFRTELYGFRVGAALAEVLSRDANRLVSQLDVLKFVCKDLWTAVYGKSIDNLKTNHRGTYVLIDNSFKPCECMGSTAHIPLKSLLGSGSTIGNPALSTSERHHQQLVASAAATAAAPAPGPGHQQATVAAAPSIWFPMGVIRGALATMGIEASVSFDAPQLPAVSFNVHTAPKR